MSLTDENGWSIDVNQRDKGIVSSDDMVAATYSIALYPTEDCAMERFLSVFSKYTGSRSAFVYDVDTSSKEMLYSCEFGIESNIWSEYMDDVFAYDERLQFLNANPQKKLYYDGQFIDERGMEKSAYYSWLRQYDYRFYAAFQVLSDPTLQHVLALQRSPSQGHFSPAEIETISRIGPHVINALAVRAALRREKARSAGLNALLEDNQVAAVLLGLSGEVLHLTDPARDLLNSNDGLSISSGDKRLRCRYNAENMRAWISKVLALANPRSAFSRPGDTTGMALAVVRPSGLPPYILRAVPRNSRPGLLTPAQHYVGACIVIVDPSQRRAVDRLALKAAFGLDDVDADLALALCSGYSLVQYAKEARCAYETARWRLKRIFAATGVSSQHELVACIFSLR